MHELNKNHYKILLDPISKIPFNTLMIRSIISGHVDGKVYADSTDNPQSFYIIHPYGMSYLTGDSNNESFNKWLHDYFTGKSPTRKKDEWVQIHPQNWDFLMNRLIDEHIAIPHTRLNFKFDSAIFYENYNQLSNPPYKIISTPTDMLFNINGQVVPKDFWKTPEQFAKIAKAFTVIIDGNPASTAFAASIHGNKLEIGIETMAEYQGKGLAYLACAKLIEYCLDNNLEPIWSCRLNNTGSVKLSKKLGFIETLRVPYYHIIYKKASV